jgi:hypothetical protein
MTLSGNKLKYEYNYTQEYLKSIIENYKPGMKAHYVITGNKEESGDF